MGTILSAVLPLLGLMFEIQGGRYEIVGDMRPSPGELTDAEAYNRMRAWHMAIGRNVPDKFRFRYTNITSWFNGSSWRGFNEDTAFECDRNVTVFQDISLKWASDSEFGGSDKNKKLREGPAKNTHIEVARNFLKKIAPGVKYELSLQNSGPYVFVTGQELHKGIPVSNNFCRFVFVLPSETIYYADLCRVAKKFDASTKPKLTVDEAISKFIEKLEQPALNEHFSPGGEVTRKVLEALYKKRVDPNRLYLRYWLPDTSDPSQNARLFYCTKGEDSDPFGFFLVDARSGEVWAQRDTDYITYVHFPYQIFPWVGYGHKPVKL